MPAPTQLIEFHITGELRPEEIAQEPFRYLPFVVPPHAVRIDVAYEATRLQPGSRGALVLDIGLFDARGIEFLAPNGFRGWSGTARKEFFIAPREATPGYRRGPLPPGTWNVILGSDSVTDSGCSFDVRIKVEVAAGAADVPEPLPYRLYEPGVLSGERRWYRGDLHAHTYHSDGFNSAREMAAEHRRRGLDFGAMTDHNLVNPDLADAALPDFLWLPGEEVTTYKGHLNVWGLGLDDWIDFRANDLDAMRRIIDAARERGALASINHPKEDGPDWIFGEFPASDCFEAWQAPWFLSNYVTLGAWEGLLRAGRRPTAVGGSDLHRISTEEDPYPYLIGQPTTWVFAEELSIPAILAGLKAGRVFVSAEPEGPRLLLSLRTSHGEALPGDDALLHEGEPATVRVEVFGGSGSLLRLIGPGGALDEWLLATNHQVVEYLIENSTLAPEYLRAEVIMPPEPGVDLAQEPDALWVNAFTNPIYMRVRPLERD